MFSIHLCSFFFFFNDTATTEIYTLSLHDALPIWPGPGQPKPARPCGRRCPSTLDRKSTRLNSSHVKISYAVFCLKKKKIIQLYLKHKKNLQITKIKEFENGPK